MSQKSQTKTEEDSILLDYKILCRRRYYDFLLRLPPDYGCQIEKDTWVCMVDVIQIA